MEDVIQWTNTETVFKEYGDALAERYKQKLIDKGHVASQRLINSIHPRPIITDTSISLVLDLEDYWKYLEEGAPAHWPPIGPRSDKSSIIDWLQEKSLPARPYNGKLPTLEQRAYLIARAIAGESPNQDRLKNPSGGMIGDHLLEEAINETNMDYEAKIEQAIAKDLDYAIDVLFVKEPWW